MNRDAGGHFRFMLVLVTCLCVAEGRRAERGFVLLFTTNKAEFRDLAVPLDHALPNWLHGLYIRNGFGQFEMGHRNVTHAFDGFAKLHSFLILPNQDFLYFTSQFLHTHYYRDSLSKNNIAPYLLFDTVDPPFSFLERASALFHGIDNTNVNVFRFEGDSGGAQSGSFNAVSDFWQSYEFDPQTLSTMRQIKAELPSGGGISSLFPVPSSAHPLPELGTTNYINFYSLLNPLPGFQNSINVMRIKSATHRELIARIPRDKIPYMHSFGLTHEYAIILAHPIFVEVGTLLETGRPLDSLSWHPELPTDVYVVRMDSGKVVHLTCPAFFFMHHINSFHDGDQLVVDFVAYKDLSFLYILKLLNLKGLEPKIPDTAVPDVTRLTIDLHQRTVRLSSFPVSPTHPNVNSLDMPVINPKYSQISYCIVYGLIIGTLQETVTHTILVKKNLCSNGTKDLVWEKTNHYPTEPWFQPNPSGSDEDDGIVISLVLDGQLDLSYLLFLDGRTLTPVSVAYLPTWVPMTLHGRFFEPVQVNHRRHHKLNSF